MKVYQLINKLKDLPKDYDIRIDYNLSHDDIENMSVDDLRLTNYWARDVEIIRKGSSGYESFGEVIILGSE
jgi:hypothetical protein